MGMKIIRQYKIKLNKGKQRVKKEEGWEFSGLLDMPGQKTKSAVKKSEDGYFGLLE